MSYTIIKGLELPEHKIGNFNKGSKFDKVIADLSIDDCVKFENKKEAYYFAKVLKDREMKGALRTIEGAYYVWRIA